MASACGALFRRARAFLGVRYSGNADRVLSPVRSVRSLPDRLQPGLDRCAARLQERRQRQFFAERFHRLVGGEARSVGRDLEQDAVGLAEIQAAKIKAVDRTGVADAEFVQPLLPRMIL